jgi:hypothetical protein
MLITIIIIILITFTVTIVITLLQRNKWIVIFVAFGTFII